MAAAELRVSRGPCHVFWMANSFLYVRSEAHSHAGINIVYIGGIVTVMRSLTCNTCTHIHVLYNQESEHLQH